MQKSSHDAFEPVVRLAGWNDTEPGIQIILGHEDGVWRFQSTEADWPEVPEPVAGDLVAMFVRAIAGTALVDAQPRAMPVDRNWLVEGFGKSEVVRFDTFASGQRQIVLAAMAIYKVHQLVVANFLDSVHAFTALIAAGPGGAWLSIDAGWSANGFVYRLDNKEHENSKYVSKWPTDETTGDFASLLPSLASMMPVVVHPAAAWELIELVAAMQAQEDARYGKEWLAFVGRAISSGTPSTLSHDPFGGETEDTLGYHKPENQDEVDPDETVTTDSRARRSVEPPQIVGRLISITSQGGSIFSVRLAVDAAGETRSYDVEARYGDGGVYFSSSDDVQEALNAMGNPPSVHDGDAFRIFATGQIIDDLFGRISTSGLLSPLLPAVPERTP